MHNHQRIQPAGAVTAPSQHSAHTAADDAEVIQAALRLHLAYVHTLDSAHSTAEEALASRADAPTSHPTAPSHSNLDPAPARRVRREALRQSSSFLEQLVEFPVSALTALTSSDMHALRIPPAADSAAAQGSSTAQRADPVGRDPAGSERMSPELPDDVWFDDVNLSDFLLDAAEPDASREVWELIPAERQGPEPSTPEGGGWASTRGTAPAPRPAFHDLVRGTAGSEPEDAQKPGHRPERRRKRQRDT